VSMKKQNEIQAIPEKRSDKTYRVVLQHFEPDAGPHGRYRDVMSVRLEGEKFKTSESMVILFHKIITALTGKGKI